jgi:hypothetical protein
MSNLHHQNHLNEDLYILLDFSCGRFYTHHSSYLKDYYDFLSLRQKTVKVWVNTSADQKVMDLFGDNVSPILRSNFYSHTRKDRLILSLIDSMVNWIYKLRIPKMKPNSNGDDFFDISNFIMNFKKNEVCNMTLDELLDKIGSEGMDSLSELEKQKLEEYSKSL